MYYINYIYHFILYKGLRTMEKPKGVTRGIVTPFPNYRVATPRYGLYLISVSYYIIAVQ